MQQELHHDQRENSRGNIVQNNSSPAWQFFQLPHWRRLHDIEPTKKYKAREHGFPRHRGKQKRDPLASDFIDHDELWIFDA